MQRGETADTDCGIGEVESGVRIEHGRKFVAEMMAGGEDGRLHASLCECEWLRHFSDQILVDPVTKLRGQT